MSEHDELSSLDQVREQVRHSSVAIAAALDSLDLDEPASATCWLVPQADDIVVYVLTGAVLHRFGGTRDDPPTTSGERRDSACDARAIPLRGATFELSVTAKAVGESKQPGATERGWTFHLPGEPPLTCTSAGSGPSARDETAFATALAKEITDTMAHP